MYECEICGPYRAHVIVPRAVLSLKPRQYENGGLLGNTVERCGIWLSSLLQRPAILTAGKHHMGFSSLLFGRDHPLKTSQERGGMRPDERLFSFFLFLCCDMDGNIVALEAPDASKRVDNPRAVEYVVAG